MGAAPTTQYSGFDVNSSLKGATFSAPLTESYTPLRWRAVRRLNDELDGLCQIIQWGTGLLRKWSDDLDMWIGNNRTEWKTGD